MAIRKGGKAGKTAKGSVGFWGIAPGKPFITNVTRVGGSYLSSSVDVYFDKNSYGAAPSSYTIKAVSYAGTILVENVTSSPARVTGLRAGALYTFTVEAKAILGQSGSYVATPSDNNDTETQGAPDKPAAPTAVSPQGATYDTVTWLAPNNGGVAITNYQVEGNDGTGTTVNALTVNISQGAGQTQAYRVRAYNANGWSEWSDYSSNVTTFSFTPFSVFSFFGVFSFVPVFSFTPFSVFGFTPFAVFGFTPFAVFGFVPFSVFSFTPFSVFSFFGVFGFVPTFSVFSFFSPFSPFSPFSVFSFAPSGCVAADTLIRTVGPDDSVVMVPAKDIVVGQEVWAPTFDELIDESVGQPYMWTAPTITNLTLVKTVLTSITPSEKTTMTINNDSSLKFSRQQGMLVKRWGNYCFIISGLLEVGDILFKVNSDSTGFDEVEVTSIELIEELSTVYKFDAEPTDLLIGGDLALHNPKYY